MQRWYVESFRNECDTWTLEPNDFTSNFSLNAPTTFCHSLKYKFWTDQSPHLSQILLGKSLGANKLTKYRIILKKERGREGELNHKVILKYWLVSKKLLSRNRSLKLFWLEVYFEWFLISLKPFRRHLIPTCRLLLRKGIRLKILYLEISCYLLERKILTFKRFSANFWHDTGICNALYVYFEFVMENFISEKGSGDWVNSRHSTNWLYLTILKYSASSGLFSRPVWVSRRSLPQISLHPRVKCISYIWMIFEKVC